MTHIVLHDTLALLKPYFLSQEHPKELFARAKSELLDVDGATRKWQGSLGEHSAGFSVMQAAQQDGYDVVTGQQIWGLFNPTRRRDVSAWEFELFESHQVMETLRESLESLSFSLAGRFPLDELNVYLFPADPANRSLMVFNHGLSAFAGGEIHIQIFPSEGTSRRLPAVMARLLIHQIRHTFGLNTLGDWLVAEGLAACFVEENFPAFADWPWLVSFRKPDDWEDTLREIARRYGLSSYDEMAVNIYGSLTQVGEDRPPDALPLPADELAYTQNILLDAISETNPIRIAAYLFGDELVAAQGHQGMGVPPFAGFEVGYRLVKRYVADAGISLAEALTTSDILTKH